MQACSNCEWWAGSRPDMGYRICYRYPPKRQSELPGYDPDTEYPNAAAWIETLAEDRCFKWSPKEK